ncbi:MAG: hypothetical protein ACYCZW_01225 [Minisyncoccota bacterium]
MNGLKLTKVLERSWPAIGFKPKLASWENTLTTAQLMEKDFPDWKIERGSRSEICLYTHEDKEMLKIRFNSFSYINEAGNDISKFKKLLKVASEHFAKNEVTDFMQFSYRHTIFFKTELKFTELVEILYEKFYGSRAELKEISVDKVNDVAFTLDGEKSGYLNHCKIGPVKKEQMLGILSPTFEVDETKLSKDDTYIYFDIEVYKDKPKFVSLLDAHNELDEMIQICMKMEKAYIDFVEKI